MKSHSRLKIKTYAQANSFNKSLTGTNFHQMKATTTKDMYNSKSIKDAAYFRNILDYSKDLFTLYNKSNCLSLVNRKLKEIQNTSLNFSNQFITLPKRVKDQEGIRENKTDTSWKCQTQSSIDQSKTSTTSVLNNYYNQLHYHNKKEKCNLCSFDSIEVMHNNDQNQLSGVTNNSKKRTKTKAEYVSLRVLTTDQPPHKPQDKTLTENFAPSKLLCVSKSKTSLLLPSLSLIQSQFKFPTRATYYYIPYSHHKQRQELKQSINSLMLKPDRHYTEHNIGQTTSKLALTHQTKQLLAKILFVHNYLSKFPEKSFYSIKPRHRKIFVMLDGTVAFNDTFIKGHLIEIPSLRYMSFLESKKTRMKLFNHFLAECVVQFKLQVPVKATFLINGTFIDDLSKIPEAERALYITTGVIFKGLHIDIKLSKKTRATTESDLELLEHKAVKLPYGKRPFGAGLMFKKKKRPLKRDKSFKVIRTKVESLLEQSFTFGLTSNSDKEDYLYYSDDEHKLAYARKAIKSSYRSHIDNVLALGKEQLDTKIKEANRRAKAIIDKYNKKNPNEKTTEGIITLVNTYNNIRAKKYRLNVSHKLKKDRQMQKQIDEKTKEMLMHFLRKLKIFQNYKDTSAVLDANVFYPVTIHKPNSIQKNIKLTQNILDESRAKIQRYYPDLISFNIPQIFKSFPTLKRREFYDIFIQFKTLLQFCVTLNKSLKVIEKGIDFNTFFNCNPQMKFQGVELAKKLYREMNTLNEKYLDWEHYMFGMLTMKNKEINDQIDLFLGIIDSDKNGALSYEEVVDLSIASLSRAFNLVSSKGNQPNEKDKDIDRDQVIFILAEFFAQFIFGLVDRPISEEIPIGQIKKKILEGGIATSYLKMFICADNFT